MGDLLTAVERALLQRRARACEDEAKAVAAVHAPAWADKEARRRHDRLFLDAGALRALVKRLDALPPVPAPAVSED